MQRDISLHAILLFFNAAWARARMVRPTSRFLNWFCWESPNCLLIAVFGEGAQPQMCGVGAKHAKYAGHATGYFLTRNSPFFNAVSEGVITTIEEAQPQMCRVGAATDAKLAITWTRKHAGHAKEAMIRPAGQTTESRTNHATAMVNATFINSCGIQRKVIHRHTLVSMERTAFKVSDGLRSAESRLIMQRCDRSHTNAMVNATFINTCGIQHGSA